MLCFDFWINRLLSKLQRIVVHLNWAFLVLIPTLWHEDWPIHFWLYWRILLILNLMNAIDLIFVKVILILMAQIAQYMLCTMKKKTIDFFFSFSSFSNSYSFAFCIANIEWHCLCVKRKECLTLFIITCKSTKEKWFIWLFISRTTSVQWLRLYEILIVFEYIIIFWCKWTN